jgi:hypothetical protein
VNKIQANTFHAANIDRYRLRCYAEIYKHRNANGSKALPDNRRQSKWLKTARITAKAAPKIAANVQKKVFWKNLTK